MFNEHEHEHELDTVNEVAQAEPKKRVRLTAEEKIELKAREYVARMRERMAKREELRAQKAIEREAQKAEARKLKIQERANREIRNGEIRPKDGSRAASLWELFDGLDTDDRNEAIAAAEEAGFKKSTAVVNFSKWRYFNGR